ncbi:MAG: alpha-ketoacid dehydrogenase subunit alpha/beta [Cyclobacteriaceae bacterium]
MKKSDVSVEEILKDYRVAWESRHASIIGRKEVFMGKAKFGIFGDGKELPQIAMAKAFKKGDWRVGYYRDQTFMFALGALSVQQFFAQLYAHTNIEADPSSAGRLMNGHFSTRLLDEDGMWKKLAQNYNCVADISPTAAQIPRIVGLGLASKYYRENKSLHKFKNFSNKGNEVAFGTIGNAATAEGIFLESVNAVGVLQVPVILAVWDDEYGISVTNDRQITKSSISKALAGFQRDDNDNGFEIFTVKGWDYENLLNTFSKAAEIAREEHVPCLVHVVELTQPQGHSTSGSHERYKSVERLQWERENDCLVKFREFILENEFAVPGQLEQIEQEALDNVKKAKEAAWKEYIATLKQPARQVSELLTQLAGNTENAEKISALKEQLEKKPNPLKMDSLKAAKNALRITRGESSPVRRSLQRWVNEFVKKAQDDYSSYLYSHSDLSALKVKEVKPAYSDKSPLVDGREVLQACFDAAFKRDPLLVAFGEDVGKIGDVNQGFAGLQEKYGEMRISDTGIRETTILGQGIGLAMRGFRPIAEIQYLDYLVFALQGMTDDLATLQYRTKGGQKAPMIIRTRGHRLEGVWHSGSPMGMILNSIRGIFVLVPRNLTQAAGMYNTMLQSDEPALMIESLNGYRLKEKLPDNIGEFTVPLGVPEILREGIDLTIVTYGSMCRIVLEAARQLEEYNISCEVIDAQTLIPFDLPQLILKSIKKTNRVVFADEDVPGGASAFMLQQVLEKQQAYKFLDSAPLTISAKEHRPAYGSDGDYFSKPNPEDIFDKVYEMMRESDPQKFPPLYL